jgi:hypothetical protein
VNWRIDVITTLDLSDEQFLRIRTDWRGYAVVFKVSERAGKKPRWTFRRETKLSVWEQMLEAPEWSNDLIAAHMNNILIEFRRWRARQEDRNA